MDDAAFQKYLTDRYNEQVAWYDANAGRNRKAARFFQNSLILSSALTPIILISHFVEHTPPLAWLALASAILNLVFTGIMRTYQFEEHWHRYQTVGEDLRGEIHFYEAGAHEYRDAQDKRAMFVQRVEEMIRRERRESQQTARRHAPITSGH